MGCRKSQTPISLSAPHKEIVIMSGQGYTVINNLDGPLKYLECLSAAHAAFLGVERSDTWDEPRVARSVAQLAYVGLAASLSTGLYTTGGRARARRTVLQTPVSTVGAARRVLTALRVADGKPPTPAAASSALDCLGELEDATGTLTEQLRIAMSDGAPTASLHAVGGALHLILDMLNELAGSLGDPAASQMAAAGPETGESAEQQQAITLPALLAPLVEMSVQLARVSRMAQGWLQAGASLHAPSRYAKRMAPLSNHAVVGLAVALEAVLGQCFIALPDSTSSAAVKVSSELSDLSRDLGVQLDQLSGHGSGDGSGSSSAADPILAVNGILPVIAEAAEELAATLGGPGESTAAVSASVTPSSTLTAAPHSPEVARTLSGAPPVAVADAMSRAADARDRGPAFPLRDNSGPAPREEPATPAPVSLGSAPLARTSSGPVPPEQPVLTVATAAARAVVRSLHFSPGASFAPPVLAATVCAQAAPAVPDVPTPAAPTVTAPAVAPAPAAVRAAPAPAAAPASDDSEPAAPARVAHARGLVEAKVLHSWLVSPAVVCWLAWFGHPLVDDAPRPGVGAAATGSGASVAWPTPTEGDDDPREAVASAAVSCASAAYGILDKVPALAAAPLDARGGCADYDSELSTRTAPSAAAFGGDSGSIGSGGRSSIITTLSAESSMLVSRSCGGSSASTVVGSATRLTEGLKAGQQIELRSDGTFVSKPSPDSPRFIVPVCAAVSLEDFERQVELHIDGVNPLDANKYHAYAVKGAGFTARSSRPNSAGAATFADSRAVPGLNSPRYESPAPGNIGAPHPPSQRGHHFEHREGPPALNLGEPPPSALSTVGLSGCDADPVSASGAIASPATPAAAQVEGAPPPHIPPSLGSSGLYDEPPPNSFLAVHSDAAWVVPLTLFDRFVRSCAEPSAQAAWHLQARFAVRAAAEAAFTENRTSGMGQRALSDLLLTGRVTACIAFAAAAVLLPFATAVVASAFSAYAHGGCAGAWAGFLPRQQAEDMLRAQAAREGGPGGYLLRLSSSRACEIVMSYAVLAGAHMGGGVASASSDGGIRVIHEILQRSRTGHGLILRGIEYPAPAQAVCANRSFLKYPCLAASLAVVGWAMPANPGVHLEASSVFSSALSPFSGLVEPAVTEAEVVQYCLEAGAGMSPFTHVGAGLPLLSYALYGRDLIRLPGTRPFTEPAVQLLRRCGEQQRAGRFVLPALSFERMRNAAAHAVCVSHSLPGVTSPAALAATAWTGPLPVPSPDVLPNASQYSSSMTTLRPFAFSAFHAAHYSQTRGRLGSKPPGSYLLRASQRERGAAILAYVDAAGDVRQSIISPDTSSTGAGTSKVVSNGRTFPSLLSVVQACSIPHAAGSSALLCAALPPASERVALRPVDSSADAVVYLTASRFEATAYTPAA